MHRCGCRGDPAIFMSASTVEMPSSGDYEKLANKPSINGVTLVGALDLTDLGVTPEAMGIDEAAASHVDEAIASLDVDEEEIEEIINA